MEDVVHDIFPPRLLDKKEQSNVLNDAWFNSNIQDIDAARSDYNARRTNATRNQKLTSLNQQLDSLPRSGRSAVIRQIESKIKAAKGKAKAAPQGEVAEPAASKTKGKGKGKAKKGDNDEAEDATFVVPQPVIALAESAIDFTDIAPYQVWLNSETFNLLEALKLYSEFLYDVHVALPPVPSSASVPTTAGLSHIARIEQAVAKLFVLHRMRVALV